MSGFITWRGVRVFFCKRAFSVRVQISTFVSSTNNCEVTSFLFRLNENPMLKTISDMPKSS